MRMDILKSNQFASIRNQRQLMIGTVPLIPSLGFIQAIHC